MKIGIITITDLDNYGNRLQLYALQKSIEKINSNNKVYAINNDIFKEPETALLKFKIFLYKKIMSIKIWNKNITTKKRRLKKFNKFTDNYINQYRKKINTVKGNYDGLDDFFDAYVIGSDQIWNYQFRGTNFGNLEFGTFSNKSNIVSYAASIGVSTIPKEKEYIYIEGIKNIGSISVREIAGKKILEKLSDKEISVMIDPTMLLDVDEWEKISEKPNFFVPPKYILNYFLGELSESRRNEIHRVAKLHNCEVINLLDPNSIYYTAGPSEFLYLEKNAFLICTDSFHSCVFAFLFNKPFIIFEREDIYKMNSRIDTLLSTFCIENRKFEKEITNLHLNNDYSKSYKILELEKNKAINYLKKSLKP